MTGLLFCLSAAAMGVDYGWQPVAGGGIEYIIQVDPVLLDSLKAGNDLFSDLPSSVNVRRYRITVGNERLPHHGEPPPAVVPAGGEAPSRVRAGDRAAQRAEPAEIDLSQLPGPVLNPAMVIEPRAKSPAEQAENDEKEPERLAHSDAAAPLGSRVTGFRQERERPGTDRTTRNQPTHEIDGGDDKGEAASTASKTENASPNERQKKPAPGAEPESPSDQASAKPDESLAKKTALTQIGLIASLSSNVFLLWMAVVDRRRYRATVRRMFDAKSAALTSADADQPRWERLPAPVKQGTAGASGGTGDQVQGES